MENPASGDAIRRLFCLVACSNLRVAYSAGTAPADRGGRWHAPGAVSKIGADLSLSYREARKVRQPSCPGVPSGGFFTIMGLITIMAAAARIPLNLPSPGTFPITRRLLVPNQAGRILMKYLCTLSFIAALATPAFAADTMSSLPADSSTVTNYYKQDVYDPSQNSIGKIDDVLIDKSGKITALMVGVGGFLGMGEKDVAFPFSAVKSEKKNDKWYLTVNETKDSLKSAAGYKYNSSTTTWSMNK
jgi:sporulation protein YlmC with PRC-barrel domain